jgi:hypothetical protein
MSQAEYDFRKRPINGHHRLRQDTFLDTAPRTVSRPTGSHFRGALGEPEGRSFLDQ